MSKFYANKTQVFWACRSLVLAKGNRIILDALIAALIYGEFV